MRELCFLLAFRLDHLLFSHSDTSVLPVLPVIMLPIDSAANMIMSPIDSAANSQSSVPSSTVFDDGNQATSPAKRRFSHDNTMRDDNESQTHIPLEDHTYHSRTPA